MDELLLRFDKTSKFTFLDGETLNLCLHPCNNQPWQVAMLETVGGKIEEDYDLHLDWNNDLKISEDAARITRFDQEYYDSVKKPVQEQAEIVYDVLKRADYIVGHNILGFDIYLIRMMFQAIGRDWKWVTPKLIDTLCIARAFRLKRVFSAEVMNFLEFQYKMLAIRKRNMKCSLGALGKEFKIEHDYHRLHNAVYDLTLNLKVWNHLKWKVEV